MTPWQYGDLPFNLLSFARESNKIEGIHEDKRHDIHLSALSSLLDRNRLTINALVTFVKTVEPGAFLRTSAEHRVWIANHEAPAAPGSKEMLKQLLIKINGGLVDPYSAHCEYEVIHPFIDGNGRSGRAVWLWQMVNQHGYGGGLGFLHKYYYQSLQNYRLSK